jgi:hypothetical protein
MTRNNALFGIVASAILAVMGAVILLVLTADGTLRIQAVAFGAGTGFWLALVLVVGKAVYGARKNVLGLSLFMAAALIVGLIYQLKWRLPYVSANSDVRCVLEQIFGMIWSVGVTGVYLSWREYKRAEN